MPGARDAQGHLTLEGCRRTSGRSTEGKCVNFLEAKKSTSALYSPGHGLPLDIMSAAMFRELGT